MTFLQAYSHRYLGDLRAFDKAYAWSTVAAQPVFVFFYSTLFWLVWLIVALAGAITIVIVAVLTAIRDSYIYKLAIYLSVVAYFGSAFWRTASLPIFAQVVFVFGLFYLFAEWSRIAQRLEAFGSDEGRR